MPTLSLAIDTAAGNAPRKACMIARSALVAAAMASLTSGALAASQPRRITIYRDAGCACCEDWAAALSSAGYTNHVNEIDHAARLRRFSIPAASAGCHTAVAEGYLIEGHVPIAAVAKLFAQRPKTRGITPPGMPSGTPGMPGPASRVAVVYLDDPQRVFYTS
jgi:hypothetical protein